MRPAVTSVGTVYFKNRRLVWARMLPGVDLSSDPCQVSSHLTLSRNDAVAPSLLCPRNLPDGTRRPERRCFLERTRRSKRKNGRPGEQEVTGTEAVHVPMEAANLPTRQLCLFEVHRMR